MKRRLIQTCIIAILMLTSIGTVLAWPPQNWGHYTHEEGTSGSWYKPAGCPGAGFDFGNYPDDSGGSFGLQNWAQPGGSYPVFLTEQNHAYFVDSAIINTYCTGSQTVIYTVRVWPGMVMASSPAWDGSANPSCTVVNSPPDIGYNCTATTPAGSTRQIRTKFYVPFGNTQRWTYVQQILRPDWNGALYEWQTWGYGQNTGP